MHIQIIKVENEEHWEALKGLLVKLFEFERQLRSDRNDHSKSINGPFNYIKENIRDHDGIAVLAMDDNNPVGFANGWVVLGDGLDSGDNRRGYFSDAFVLEEYRGQGIYRQLVDARVKHFAALGIDRMMVDTLGTNTEMQKILQQCGFGIHKIIYEMKI